MLLNLITNRSLFIYFDEYIHLIAQLEKARILQEESQCEWEQERAKHDKLLKDSEDTCTNSLAALEHDKRVAIGELSHRILQNSVLTCFSEFDFYSLLTNFDCLKYSYIIIYKHFIYKIQTKSMRW